MKIKYHGNISQKGVRFTSGSKNVYLGEEGYLTLLHGRDFILNIRGDLFNGAKLFMELAVWMNRHN